MNHKLAIALLCLCAAAACAADGVRVTVMSFNLHAGHDASLHEIALLIKERQPDFVALQEVDCGTHRANARHQNGRDFVTELAYRSGMMGLYGPAIKFSGGLYGIGLLTRHPYCQSRNIMLPNPNSDKEQRALLEALVVLPGGDTIAVACTHLEAFDSLNREAQIAFLLTHYAHTQHPTLLAGDFNALPTDSVMTRLMPLWLDCTNRQPTFSTTKPEEKIDYIFARPQQRWRLVSTEVIQRALSDHYPVISTLELVR